MLTLAEEIALLALHDEDGSFIPLPEHALEFALTSSVIMELMLHARVDADLEQLMLVDSTPVGDDILDPVLVALERSQETYNAHRWIMVLAQEAEPLKRRVLDRLVARGVLRKEQQKFLWMLGRRRYPVIDGSEQREAKLRILNIILSDEVPDQRDVVLIALAKACSIIDSILTPRELRAAAPRIAQVARMDLVGQALITSLADMRDWGRWVGSPREKVWDQAPDTATGDAPD